MVEWKTSWVGAPWSNLRRDFFAQDLCTRRINLTKLDRIEQNSRRKLPKKLEKKESSSEKFFWGIEREFQAWKIWFCSEIFSSTSPRQRRRPRQCACVCDRACRSLTGWLALFPFPTGIPWQRTMKGKDLNVAGNLHKHSSNGHPYGSKIPTNQLPGREIYFK